MSSTEWDPTDDDSDRDKKDRFGDALAALAVETSPDLDPVDAVRESRRDV
ncbi:hypothetical protein [Natronomonas sp.]